MRGLGIAVTVLGLCLTSSAAPVRAFEYSMSWLTTNWFRLSGVPDPDGYTSFRKYALVIGSGPSGEPTFDRFRNVMILNCAKTTEYISHINFVIPEEIDVPAHIGRKHVERHRISVVHEDGTHGQLVVEVAGNELFADFEDANRVSLDRVMRDPAFILVLSSDYGFGLGIDGRKVPWLNGEPRTFDVFMEEQIRLNNETAEVLTTPHVLRLCSGI